MMRLKIALIIVFGLSALPVITQAGCLEYAPKTVSITGTLQRRTFPGPPNYESIKKGDSPETGFYVALKKPICTNGDSNEVDRYPARNVKFVQLILPNQQHYQKLRPYLGKKIRLSGQLTAMTTGHHHAPLLLEEVQLNFDVSDDV